MEKVKQEEVRLRRELMKE
jgi:hypothetical protein